MGKILRCPILSFLFIVYMITTCLLILAVEVRKSDGSEMKLGMETTLNSNMEFSMNHIQNVHPSSSLLRKKREKQLSKNDTAAELDFILIIEKKDEEINRLKEELDRKASLLRNVTSEKENEIVKFNRTYFKDKQKNSELLNAAHRWIEKAVENLVKLEANLNAGNYSETPVVMASAMHLESNTTVYSLPVKQLMQQKANTSNSDIEVKRPRNCEDIHTSCNKTSGIYTIFPFESKKDVAVEVYCDFVTDGGGWTLFQRRRQRISATVDFERTWREYADGFSGLSPTDSHWLGLNIISELTKAGDSRLRIDMTDWYDYVRFAEYRLFQVANETDKFKLTVGNYVGDAGDALTYHNGMYFSTMDQDNDKAEADCAQKYRGAWWYNSCLESNLNGLYEKDGTRVESGTHIVWQKWRGITYSLKTTEMKVRSRNFKGLDKCNKG